MINRKYNIIELAEQDAIAKNDIYPRFTIITLYEQPSKMKLADGETRYNDLPYVGEGEDDDDNGTSSTQGKFAYTSEAFGGTNISGAVALAFQDRYENMINYFSGELENWKIADAYTSTPSLDGATTRLRNGNYYRLLRTGYVPVEKFGVKGTFGNTTTLIDDTVAFQKAIDSGLNLICRTGVNYYVSDTLVINTQRQIIDFNRATLRSIGDLTTKVSGVTVLDSNGNPNSAKYLLELAADYSRVENVLITGNASRPAGGILMSGFRTCISDVYMQGDMIVGNCVNMQGAESQLTGKHNKLRGATKDGVYINKVDCEVHNSYVEYADQVGYAGIRITGGIGSTTLTDVHIFHCYDGLYVNGAGRCFITNVYADTSDHIGITVNDSVSNSFINVWDFKSGVKYDTTGFKVLGASRDNVFRSCWTTSNQSANGVAVGFQINSMKNDYYDCNSGGGDIIITGDGKYRGRLVIGGDVYFSKLGNLSGFNTGDETGLSINTKYSQLNTYYTINGGVTTVNGLYVVNVPELYGRTPTSIERNSIVFEPVKYSIPSGVQVGFDLIGNLYFTTPLTDGSRIHVISIPNENLTLPSVPYIFDNFAISTNQALSGSAANDGKTTKTWTTYSTDGTSSFGIENGILLATGNTTAVAYVDTAQSNYRVKATVAQVKSSGTNNRRFYMIFRYQDPNNYLYISALPSTSSNFWGLGKVVSGVNTVLYTSTVVPDEKDTIEVDVVGSTIVFYINSILQGFFNITQLTTATKVGFAGDKNYDPFSGWSNIKIYNDDKPNNTDTYIDPFANYISNSSDTFGTKITQIVSLTQAQYDGLTPVGTTLYVITD